MKSSPHFRRIPALLLAAGKGTRLSPLTDSIPKCLVPIGKRPLLDLWLERCVHADFDPIIVNTHHFEGMVRDFILKSPWRNRVTLVHEEELRGTAGTLLDQRHLLGNGTFFVAHADNLSFFNMDDFFHAHMTRPRHCLMTMMLFRTPTPQSCGIVEIDMEGVVVAFHEKVPNPPGDLANGAVYFMEPQVLDIVDSCINIKPDISLDLVPECLGCTATFLNNQYHRDIGTPESYAKALEDVQRSIFACH